MLRRIGEPLFAAPIDGLKVAANQAEKELTVIFQA
jgi:hypothetical protein